MNVTELFQVRLRPHGQKGIPGEPEKFENPAQWIHPLAAAAEDPF